MSNATAKGKLGAAIYRLTAVRDLVKRDRIGPLCVSIELDEVLKLLDEARESLPEQVRPAYLNIGVSA